MVNFCMSYLHVMMAHSSVPNVALVALLHGVATYGLCDSRYGNASHFCRWTCPCCTAARTMSLHLLGVLMAQGWALGACLRLRPATSCNLATETLMAECCIVKTMVLLAVQQTDWTTCRL